MSPATSAIASQGPIALLLQLTRQILDAERQIRRQRLLYLGIGLLFLFGPVLFMALLLTTIATFRTYDMLRINCTLLPVVAACSGMLVFGFRELRWDLDLKTSIAEHKLSLNMLREQRRLRAADLALDARYARSAYKEKATADVDSLRKESRYYRRIHNTFQSIIIVGSLATTTVSGIALDSSPLQWIVVATSFTVGLAAGFTGYFKYRERGFYLQQTADAIEQEWTAVELDIFRYRAIKDDEKLGAFVEEVERLKMEQRKREQSLDQQSGQSRDMVQ